MSLSIVVNGRDVTGQVTGLTCSNVDPGGFEQAAMQVPRLTDLYPGRRATVRWGLSTVWEGFISEPAETVAQGRVESRIACVGYGALLKRDTMRQLYVDRDLQTFVDAQTLCSDVSQFGGTGLHPNGTVQVTRDGQGRAVIVTFPRGTVLGASAKAQAAKDYGDLRYTRVILASQVSGNDGSCLHIARSSNTDYNPAGDGTATFSTQANNLTGTWTFDGSTSTARFLLVFIEDSGAGHTISSTVDVVCRVTDCVVIGDSGLTVRGSSSADYGFYPQDIIGHALDQAGLGWDRNLSTDTSYTVLQAIYPDPVSHEQVIADQAKRTGKHWGTWEPASALSDRPRFIYADPPTSATCVVFRSECDELQQPAIRADRLYDTCRVTYTTPAGAKSMVTVTQSNELADQAGYDAGTLTLDMGVGSSAAATTLGQFALNLAQQSARGSGSAVLPDTVRLPGGGRLPACLLKAGRDRIRIADLPVVGGFLASDTRRYDTFLIRRVETTIDEYGTPRTRVEFDQGADLLEVLVARLTEAVGLVT